jgi:UDP-N-acetylmuramoyl-tripeptide--D-alanyl-D-alanine ligase
MKRIKELYEHFLLHRVITTDSRNCPQNSIFFALKGDNFNGNDYAINALNQGCSLAVVDDPYLPETEGLFKVENVLAALQQLAAYHRSLLTIPIIGITGSNGKTTTKELVTAVLRKKFKVFATLGNLNNHIGVPVTLLSIPPDAQIGVVEMGANHQGEIRDLCNIANPGYGLITNVGKAHLEGFGSFEGVKKTKSELYQHVTQQKGIIFVNADNAHLMELINKYPNTITYGIHNDQGVITGKNITVNPFLHFSWKSKESTHWQNTQTLIIGAYNAENALAAIAIGTHFGVSNNDINDAIAAYNPTNNRSQLIATPTNKILMDAYNANPSSMSVAIQNFTAIEHPNKIMILGGMKELGNVSEEEHSKLLNIIANENFKTVLLVGNEFKVTNRPTHFQYFETTAELMAYFKLNPPQNSFILIKGSRSNQLENLLPALQH